MISVQVSEVEEEGLLSWPQLVSPSELAGILGPFQRRMVKGGFPTALTSRTASVGQRRVKVLRLADGLAAIIRVCAASDGTKAPTKAIAARATPCPSRTSG